VINRKLVAIAILAGAVACKSDANQANAASTGSNVPGDTSKGGGGNGGGQGGRRGGGAGRGGRPASAITLAASDVGVVKHDVIEAGIPITGDLRPIETIGVRARIEGDLVDVLVREGQRVAGGQLLARFESSEQETTQASAEADVSSAKSDEATAQWNLDQSRDLFKAGAIAERDLKVAEQTLESAKAKLAAANARLKSSSNMQRDTRVVAPSAGIIEKRLVQTGERVTRGQQLFSLVRNDALELTASVPAKQASAVVTGQAVHFAADGKDFDGKVARVSPTIDPTTRAITVYVQVPNRDGALKGGTFATGRVVQKTISNALIVPMPAVRQSQENGQTFVYRIADRVIDVASVTLGVIDERAGKAEVLSGLSDGDRVIIGNVGTLGRGMQVTVLGSEDQGGFGGSRRGGRGGGGRGGKGRGQQQQPASASK
jgi:membrane fusion protein, multidrug efflux system